MSEPNGESAPTWAGLFGAAPDIDLTGEVAEREALTEAVRSYLRLYLLPANVAAYLAPDDTHDRVAERCAPLLVEHITSPAKRGDA